MNFNSRILKLSILIMLVLVLIPAVSAENSTDTFFVEYDVVEDQGYVEEYDSSDFIVEDTQETSWQHDEVGVVNEEDQGESTPDPEINEPIKTNDDIVEISNDIEVEQTFTPQVDYVEVNDTVEICPVDDDFYDVDGDIESNSSDNKFTLYCNDIETSFNYCTVSKFNAITNLFNFGDELIFCNGFSFQNSNFQRNLMKHLDMKDNLLNDNLVMIYYINGSVLIELDVEDYNNKHLGDFAYSIDNSIVGDECRYLFDVYSIFSCFDTFYNIEFFPCAVFDHFDNTVFGFDEFYCNMQLNFVNGNLLLNFEI